MLVLLCLYSCQLKLAHAINEVYLFMSEEDCLNVLIHVFKPASIMNSELCFFVNDIILMPVFMSVVFIQAC